MSSTPDDPRAACAALCERLFEGTLGPDEKQALERLVLDSAEARRTYVELVHLHAGLRRELGAGAPALATVVAPRRRWSARAVRLAAVPALLALGVSVGALWRRPPRPVATLTAARSARFSEATLPTAAGARLAPGRLTLAEGLVTLTFDSGAEVVLQGPATLEIVSSRGCVLHVGALVARVPPAAVGFVVRSATAVLVDHGTEFGVTAAADGETRVEVQSGLVEARPVHADAPLRLTTGEAAVFHRDGVPTRGRIAGEPRTAAAERPSGADVVISTASGRGLATFVRSRPHADDVLPPEVLLVKNTEDGEWQRKAYLAFDLASLPSAGERAIAEATLTVSLVATGLGHAAFVPDATFAVYGVPESLDATRARTLTWDTAPGQAPGGAGVSPAATLVGRFVVPQGATSGRFGVGGPALVAFLRGQRQGPATFLLVRETAETRPHGLVHGFAGSHHPTAAPPTLRLTLR